MSFFRNLRSSITRGRSSSRDTTPVRNSRSGSVISSLNSGSSSKRRDSIESRCDSLLNRSDTFILDHSDATPCHSNCSTLEKKSKKSKVLEKFSTFTKRKKKPHSEGVTFEHHPSDNATNTYYKWQAEGGGNSLDYDSQNDPFNFLYEQQSSLKTLQTAADGLKSSAPASSSSFDSSTYRKSKLSTDLKKQLKILKDQDLRNQENNIKPKVQEIADEKGHEELNEEEEEEEREALDDENEPKADKYKTVTINSFRRSFKEKFLQQQRDVAHNPAWFVEVEAPETSKNKMTPRDSSKENRLDLLVFENENYRPGSRSPVRDPNSRKEPKPASRSPIKRNETFKIERSSRLDQQPTKMKAEDNTASIRIEFKNSITPHVPGRMVPVGVAKPMPSSLTYNNYYRKIEPTHASNSFSNKASAGTTLTRLNSHSPIRPPWLKPQSPCRTANPNPTRVTRYQTLVQIKNEKSQEVSPITTRKSRQPTRIQLGGSATSSNPTNKGSTATHSPSLVKRYNSSQLLSSSGNRAQPPRRTYFGETPQAARVTQIPSSLSSSTNALRTRPAGTSNYGGYKYHTPALFASATSLTSGAATPSHSVSNIHSSSNNLSYPKSYQQHQHQHQPLPQQKQTRFLMASQRRSRSPIKVPWR